MLKATEIKPEVLLSKQVFGRDPACRIIRISQNTADWKTGCQLKNSKTFFHKSYGPNYVPLWTKHANDTQNMIKIPSSRQDL
jgi:hypothetical protein